MLGAIKAIPETIKNWRDNRDLLYQLVTALSAALVVTAIASARRPSDSLASVAHGLGATPVANWFGTNAPPVLAVSIPSVQSIALSAVLLLLAGMVAVPFWGGRHDSQMFGYEPFRLIGSPAASTIWILLLIATQQGDIASTPAMGTHGAFGGSLDDRWVARDWRAVPHRQPFRVRRTAQAAVRVRRSLRLSDWPQSLCSSVRDRSSGHLTASLNHQLDERSGVRPRTKSPARDRDGMSGTSLTAHRGIRRTNPSRVKLTPSGTAATRPR